MSCHMSYQVGRDKMGEEFCQINWVINMLLCYAKYLWTKTLLKTMQLFHKLPFRHRLHWLHWCKDSDTICSNTHHTHFLLTKLCAGMLRVAGKIQEVSDIVKDRRTFILVIQALSFTLPDSEQCTHHNPLQHHELFIGQHSITPQHTWSFGSPLFKPQNLRGPCC